jgi:cytoskeleton protein RodZ
MDKTIAAMTMEPDREPKGAAKVGMELRLVRERLGWRLGDVAAELRIRMPYLEAIERGELSALPGAAYQTGFVRTYAQALGLDGDEILRRFRAEGTGFVPKAELSFLAPVPDRAVPTGAIVLVGVVLVLVGYGLWYRHTAQDAQLAAQVPTVPTELAPLAVPPKPPAAATQVKTAAATAATAAAPEAAAPAAGTPPADTQATPQQTARTAPAAATAAAPEAAAAASPTPALPSAAATTPAATSGAQAAAIPATAAAPAQQTIVATGDSWVQVQDAKGGILFSKTLHAGDTWPVPNLPGLVMTAGNAGATLIADNGKPGAPLGTDGTVIRKYPLTPPAPGSAAAIPAASTTTPAGTPIAGGSVQGPSPSAPVSTN